MPLANAFGLRTGDGHGVAADGSPHEARSSNEAHAPSDGRSRWLRKDLSSAAARLADPSNQEVVAQALVSCLIQYRLGLKQGAWFLWFPKERTRAPTQALRRQ